MEFEFPFNLDDTPKQPSIRHLFDSFDRSIFEEQNNIEKILHDIDERLSQNFNAIEDDSEIFVFLFNLILYISEKTNTNKLQRTLAKLLSNVNSLLIPEFFKFNIDIFSMNNQDKIQNSTISDPVLQENADKVLGVEEELGNNPEFKQLARVSKKFHALTMLYFLKGLRYKRKDISNNKSKLKSGKNLLNGFDDLFQILYKMVKNGSFLAIANTTGDKYMVKHLLNTLGRLLVSNLMERKLFCFNLLELYSMITRHKYFDKNTIMRDIIMALENDNAQIRKFIVKLLKSFLKKKEERQISLIVEFSETIMNNLIKKKNFTPEGQFAKNCKILYIELAQHHPAFFYHNYIIFRNFYASDSYFFRNIANEITFFIIKFIHEKKERASYFENRRSGSSSEVDRVAKLNDIKLGFLDLILGRLEDKTVYTRSNTLYIISKLLKNRLLEGDYIFLVFDLISKKNVDISYNVRRRCLILIQEFLIYFKDILELPSRGTIYKLLENENQKKKRKKLQIEEETNIFNNDEENEKDNEEDNEEDCLNKGNKVIFRK